MTKGTRAALISVSDRTGLVEFAKTLSSNGYVLLATSGSATALEAAGLKTLRIEEYTGQKEILDGRVKTLHPKIHAGLLARRDKPEHVAQLESEGILPIDVAVVNLYPFIQNLSGEAAASPDKMIELVDIGGPTMIRAAAKNFKGVLPVIDPADYAMVSEHLSAWKQNIAYRPDLRLQLCVKVMTRIAEYDLQIARYFSNVAAAQADASPLTVDLGNDLALGAAQGTLLLKEQNLRYGENPHQKAAFYRQSYGPARSWKQLAGKELSYNNLLDFDAALKIVRGLPQSKNSVVIIKHLNPCGAASGGTLLEALKKAKRSDPRSHFGGIIAFNAKVTAEVAEEVREDFAEIVVAPEYDEAALTALQKSKNLRVLTCSLESSDRWELRSIEGGALVQQLDPGVSKVRDAEVVSRRKPTENELEDLQFAWALAAQVKSNAIVIARDQTLIGTGAGQMSRIDSVELALHKAKTHDHSVSGSVAASDAFFPFPDGLETLAKAGVSAIVAPSGAKRDAEVIAVADALNVSLLFVPDRHFRH